MGTREISPLFCYWCISYTYFRELQNIHLTSCDYSLYLFPGATNHSIDQLWLFTKRHCNNLEKLKWWQSWIQRNQNETSMNIGKQPSTSIKWEQYIILKNGILKINSSFIALFKTSVFLSEQNVQYSPWGVYCEIFSLKWLKT